MTIKIDGGLPKHLDVGQLEASQKHVATARESALPMSVSVDSVQLTGEAAGIKAMARELATSAKVDESKVSEIRSAIEAGTYDINPKEIASRMLALERQLTL
jgi:negative regulator of flagellin synthesis FlgM